MLIKLVKMKKKVNFRCELKRENINLHKLSTDHFDKMYQVFKFASSVNQGGGSTSISFPK